MSSFVSPDFDHAPLIEVALSVQFQPLSGLTSAYAGRFWSTISQEFVQDFEQPPLSSINEFFGKIPGPAGALSIGLTLAPPGVRNWFMTADKTYLVQVQRNRFALNWRKTGNDSPYPRYPAIRAKFGEVFGKFSDFLRSANLGDCLIDMYEVSYINQWFFSGTQNYDQGLGSWLNLDTKQLDHIELESAAINAQYLLKGKSDQPIGRMYINVSPILSGAGERGINLELVCRVIPSPTTRNLDFSALDLAREKIVTTFTQITSDSAQRAWRGQ